MEVNVSQHCKMRYVERLKDINNKTDIASYIIVHEDMIIESISKMVEFGRLVYTGPAGKDNQITRVYVNGLWILLTTDDDPPLAVTIYKIDLGLGEDFDKEYMTKYLEKLDEAQKDSDISDNEIDQEIDTYCNIINDLNEEIASYKRNIKQLQETVSGYEEYIKSLRSKKFLSSKSMRDIINKMIGKIKF